jgi:hypothetical protein
MELDASRQVEADLSGRCYSRREFNPCHATSWSV